MLTLLFRIGTYQLGRNRVGKSFKVQTQFAQGGVMIVGTLTSKETSLSASPAGRPMAMVGITFMDRRPDGRCFAPAGPQKFGPYVEGMRAKVSPCTAYVTAAAFRWPHYEEIGNFVVGSNEISAPV